MIPLTGPKMQYVKRRLQMKHSDEPGRKCSWGEPEGGWKAGFFNSDMRY